MRVALGLVIALLSGCVFKEKHRDVVMEGTLEPPRGVTTGPDVRIDHDGHAWRGEHRLHLPRAFEDARYGIVLLDTTPLPPGWRLPFARDGGIVVALVDVASPLGIAGLRPCDVLRTVDGVEPASVHEAIAALERSPRPRLEVRRPDGRVDAVSATPGEGHTRSSRVTVVPLTVESSATATYVDVFPLVFHVQAGLRYVQGRGYTDHVTWGALLDLVTWQSWTDPATGETARRLRLGGLLYFGDRPWEEDRWWVD